MPVLILVNKSSVPQQRDESVSRAKVADGAEFQIMVERRAGYQAAFVKVIQQTPAGATGAAKPKVHRVSMEQTHNLCQRDGVPITWRMSGPAEVHVAWLPERAVRSKYVSKSNGGDHTCTLECECVPDNQFVFGSLGRSVDTVVKERLLQSYPPFPGMPASNGRARDMNSGWVDRWQSLPLTPELVAAKQAMKAKITALNEEYDIKPADVEKVLLG
jgi:hypothetical protein